MSIFSTLAYVVSTYVYRHATNFIAEGLDCPGCCAFCAFNNRRSEADCRHIYDDGLTTFEVPLCDHFDVWIDEMCRACSR